MHDRPPYFVASLLASLLAFALVVGRPAIAQAPGPAPEAPTPSATPATSPQGSGGDASARPSHSAPTIVAAGDIACDPRNPSFNRGRGKGQLCRQKATARLIGLLDPDAVLPLGDTQYDDGRLRKYKDSYALSWGKYLDITHPAVGNHEYITNATGYEEYFGRSSTPDGTTYYSFELGTWHLIALDSNCWAVPCGPGSPQYEWLKSDLQAATSRGDGICQVAYFHHPRFSSGLHGDNRFVSPLWRLLYTYGVDVVLNGHDHSYERFAPMTPLGEADRKAGVREFIVGTGGAEHYPIRDVQPHSQRRNGDTFGLLELTLHPDAYDWRFVPMKGATFTDSGTAPCH